MGRKYKETDVEYLQCFQVTPKNLFKIFKCPFHIQQGFLSLTIKTPSRYVGYVKGIAYNYLPVGLWVKVIKDDSIRGKTLSLEMSLPFSQNI